MYWKSSVNLDTEQLTLLNNVAEQYSWTSEPYEPNILIQFPDVLKKISVLLDEYLKEKSKIFKKTLVMSWLMNQREGTNMGMLPHRHAYASLSFVFYTMSNGDNPLIVRDGNDIEYEIESKTNDFIILSSDLIHFPKNGGPLKEARISYAGDILLTQLNYENSNSLSPKEVWHDI